MSNLADFMNVDLEITSKEPYPEDPVTVEVTVAASKVMADFAAAIVEEMYRMNYDKAKQVNLTEDELTTYFEYLLTKRIQCVHMVCKDFRLLKLLYIPSYVQFTLSLIGRAIDRDQGLIFMPKLVNCDDIAKVNIAEFADMLAISEKLASFENELQMVRDAMPRDIDGDLNFMSTALIGEYVAACRKIDHPMTTYVTTFLDMRLKEESTYALLYRRKYGDARLIAQVLTKEKRLFKKG